MKKERFVRLLMAYRYQRNEAYAIAEAHQKDGHTYEEAWECEKSKAVLHATGCSMKKASKSIRKITDAIAMLGLSVSDAARSMQNIGTQMAAIRESEYAG